MKSVLTPEEMKHRIEPATDLLARREAEQAKEMAAVAYSESLHRKPAATAKSKQQTDDRKPAAKRKPAPTTSKKSSSTTKGKCRYWLVCIILCIMISNECCVFCIIK